MLNHELWLARHIGTHEKVIGKFLRALTHWHLLTGPLADWHRHYLTLLLFEALFKPVVINLIQVALV